MTQRTAQSSPITPHGADTGSGGGPLLVGVDWSDDSHVAVRWTGLLAHTLDCDVIALHASSPWVGLELAVPPFDYDLYRKTVEDAVDGWTEGLADAHHEVVIVEDEPAHALVLEASKIDPTLVVVGAHATGGWMPRLLGSVTSKVIHGCESPVAVTPASTRIEPIVDDVVVGVDGSPASLRALRWAAKWAGELGVRVYALCAFPMEAYSEKPRLTDLSSVDPIADTLDALRQLSHQVTHESGVEVASDVEIGAPAERLIGAGRGGSALVIGKTGSSTFAELVFGSVSRTCATHSDVPVVLIP